MDLFLLVVALFLVGFNAFFVATEFALVKVRPTRIEELIRKAKPGARTTRHLIAQLDNTLSATQLGITLTSLALGWLGETAFSRLFLGPLSYGLRLPDPIAHTVALVLAFVAITLLHIVLGELVPKSLAIRQAESVALAVARPMRAFYALFFPFIWTLNQTSSKLLHILGFNENNNNDNHTEEELKIILTQARSAGLLSASRSALLTKVLTLPTKTARHLMVPRNDVIFLDINLPLEENLSRAMGSGHTRFPLCDRELDEVLGVIDVRQLLHQARQSTGIRLRDLAVNLPYFPELMSSERLLQEFRSRHAPMAIVVDEYGGASGIITPADVVSAVMGDLIEDNEVEVVALPGGAYDVEGAAPLEEIEETLKITLGADNMRTLAGFLMEHLGRMPKVGDRVVHQAYTFYILEVVGPKVGRVRIQRHIAHSDLTPNNLPS